METEFERARDCLRYLVKKYDIKEMEIPYYLCDVMRHTLVDEGCKPLFYHIDDSFMPSCEFSKDAYILYPNYFGICQSNVKILTQKYPKLIVDNAHAYYDTPIGFACFNAGHKFGKETSFLWESSDSEGYPQIPQDNSRKTKFLELHKKYSCKNQLKIDIESIISPFVYPLLTETEEEADILAKELQDKGLTIYRYWNPLPKNYNEYKFYSRLLPIPLG